MHPTKFLKYWGIIKRVLIINQKLWPRGSSVTTCSHPNASKSWEIIEYSTVTGCFRICIYYYIPGRAVFWWPGRLSTVARRAVFHPGRHARWPITNLFLLAILIAPYYSALKIAHLGPGRGALAWHDMTLSVTWLLQLPRRASTWQ